MHLALICPDLTGHLNPMTTLGRALKRRGHQVSLVASPESRGKAESAGLGFLPIGLDGGAADELEATRVRLGRSRGLAALRLTGLVLRQSAAILLRDAPPQLRRARIDAVLADQVSAGSSVAEALDLPFAVVCNALALHQEPDVPPPMTDWGPSPGPLGRLRNRIGNAFVRFVAKPFFDEIERDRRKHGLPTLQERGDDYGLLHVAQQPAFFDFPRRGLPDHFHYTGPWHEPKRDADVPFPWDRLDGRPLIYASLGTLQNRLPALFARIAAACAAEDAQLVLSLGRAGATLDPALAPEAIVVPFAPQLALLRRASAVITHAGLNTALETLACGLPMVAIPLANDQPGVARRLAWLGAAAAIPPRRVTVDRLRVAVRAVLREPAYCAAAIRCQAQLRRSPGVDAAAELVDRAFRLGIRLTRDDVARTEIAAAS